jgi:tetratricopeptide (TPR) repeat protein
MSANHTAFNMKSLFSVLLAILFSAINFMNCTAQERSLGVIHFPNSGAESAQPDFLEGVKFLHNFEYADAARSFKKAREEDPSFVLAYWGEALTHNHPIWYQQNREEAMEVLNQLGETVQQRQEKAPMEREKDYLMSLEVLYGNTSESAGKSKEERDILYMETMKELHEKYPDDHEITAFYGLSILGTAHEGRDFSIYMKAAAVLFDVWNENPEHPGAAHYLIHSFDDPIHAPLGLPMAKAYSRIAPAAAHAQHMTSHIFLALGMWDDVIDANETARDVQTARQAELNESLTVCGHYPWWLQYGYLQEGRTTDALNVLQACNERIEGDPTPGEMWHFAVMRGHYIVDSENWSEADNWAASVDAESRAGRNYYFTSALAAIHQDNMAEAMQNLENLEQSPDSPERDIQADQIRGLLHLAEGETDEGLSLLRRAAAAESELPVDFGPPAIVKPSYELLGDALMDLGRHTEALEAYQKQLERTPNRMRSVAGSIKAVQPVARQESR